MVPALLACLLACVDGFRNKAGTTWVQSVNMNRAHLQKRNFNFLGPSVNMNRAHLRKRNLILLGPSVNMNRAHLRKRNLIFLVQV